MLVIAACDASPNAVTVNLSPEVISSIDGGTMVRAIVLADREPAIGERVTYAVAYTDRNGVDHPIASVEGTTDEAGAFEAPIDGLLWDGTGDITVTVAGAAMLEGSASFAVLDRTPPKATIMAPSGTIARGADMTIMVHVEDEIGISEAVFESSGTSNGNGNNGSRQRRTVVASGSTDTALAFDITASDQAIVGSTIELFALVSDLSGNQAAAAPVTLTVTQ